MSCFFWIVISAMARKKEAEGWVLSPGGRQIIKSKHLGMYYVKNDEELLVLRSLNGSTPKKPENDNSFIIKN